MHSRRQWLGRLLMLPGMVTGMVGLARRGEAETGGRVTKAAARYQDRPNNGQMCSMCKFYIPAGGQAGSGMMGGHMGPGMMAAGTCQVVKGSISPMGWCVLYQPLSD
jgi:hypothetical protein